MEYTVTFKDIFIREILLIIISVILIFIIIKIIGHLINRKEIKKNILLIIILSLPLIFTMRDDVIPFSVAVYDYGTNQYGKTEGEITEIGNSKTFTEVYIDGNLYRYSKSRHDYINKDDHVKIIYLKHSKYITFIRIDKKDVLLFIKNSD